MIKSDSTKTLFEGEDEPIQVANPLKAPLIDLESDHKETTEMDRSLADISNVSPKASQMTPQRLLKTLASLPPVRITD